ncbi:MAG: exo-alpha-sialidase, partial [Lentisphaeria bacterium]|nr:exo-alpha-sialidase [Lentisphaeria bacterium]
MDLDLERNRSCPDYVVYSPKSVDGSTFDTGNEHFLVFDGPDGSLMAVWTQSSYEGAGDHRIVFARSDDEGETWTAPKLLAGCPRPKEGMQASWGFPMVSASGRIYVVYNQFTGKIDYHHQMTGTMDVVCSDDAGATWSAPQTVPMPKSPLYDHDDPEMPSNWIVWQRPERLSNDKYFVGFTRWLSPQKCRANPTNSWTAHESVVEFMRFENVDDDPEPGDLQISHFAWGDQALRAPHYRDPLLSIAQEPSLILLPDGRLFCTMRSMSGYIWYTVSGDAGETWCSPRPLL